MKRLIAAAALLLMAAPAYAIKPCEELKSEIDAKLQEKGVKGYSLEIVANEEVKGQKVVGSCEGGSKTIVYKREK